MRNSVVRGVCVAAMAAVAACRVETEVEDVPRLARVAPASVTDAEAWRLFDRSTATSFTPSSSPVEVTFERPVAIAAIKVYGGAPYRLRAGSDAIDLSKLGAGWHAFEVRSPSVVDHLDLRFELLG